MSDQQGKQMTNEEFAILNCGLTGWDHKNGTCRFCEPIKEALDSKQVTIDRLTSELSTTKANNDNYFHESLKLKSQILELAGELSSAQLLSGKLREALEKIAKNGHSDQPEELWADPHNIAREALSTISPKVPDFPTNGLPECGHPGTCQEYEDKLGAERKKAEDSPTERKVD